MSDKIETVKNVLISGFMLAAFVLGGISMHHAFSGAQSASSASATLIKITN
jgi:hypothetical protein